jgi:hypothetical protein
MNTIAMGQLRDQKRLNQSLPRRSRGVKKMTRNASASTTLSRINMAFIFIKNPYNRAV